MTSVIYDFETLGNDPVRCAALDLAFLSFDEDRFSSKDPYTFNELFESVKYIKFDVEEQVKKYNRIIQKSTLDWWADQPKEAQKILSPSSNDRSISELHDFLTSNVDFKHLKKYYTRGNNFDPVLMRELMIATGKNDPFVPYWNVRDMRSLIDGITYGLDVRNTFIPDIPEIKENFVPHDCRHDIVMDVMRFQYLVQAL